jgi:hypothetical protein
VRPALTIGCAHLVEVDELQLGDIELGAQLGDLAKALAKLVGEAGF